MKVLLVDNYDSFTYNLVHLVKSVSSFDVEVRKNDEVSLEEVKNFQKILLSPGPGLPSDAGIMIPLIQEYAPSKSIMGVCLGHQAIAEAFGGKLVNLPMVFHGVSSTITFREDSLLFRGLPQPMEAGRYHSWTVEESSLPSELMITARDEENRIMAMQHQTFDLHSVQFHPESVLTPEGGKILQNWLNSQP